MQQDGDNPAGRQKLVPSNGGDVTALRFIMSLSRAQGPDSAGREAVNWMRPFDGRAVAENVT